MDACVTFTAMVAFVPSIVAVDIFVFAEEAGESFGAIAVLIRNNRHVLVEIKKGESITSAVCWMI